MDYQKMWFAMKERLLKEADQKDATVGNYVTGRHLKWMSEIEVEAMAESQHVCECGGLCNPGEPEPPKGEQAKPDPEATANKGGESKEKQSSADVLKDIFREHFVSDVETLEKKIKEGKEPVILVDGELEVPEHLEKEAREKGIAIGHAFCEAVKVGEVRGGIPFPLPFLPGFLK